MQVALCREPCGDQLGRKAGCRDVLTAMVSYPSSPMMQALRATNRLEAHERTSVELVARGSLGPAWFGSDAA
jgi:hypothetical protein